MKRKKITGLELLTVLFRNTHHLIHTTQQLIRNTNQLVKITPIFTYLENPVVKFMHIVLNNINHFKIYIFVAKKDFVIFWCASSFKTLMLE